MKSSCPLPVPTVGCGPLDAALTSPALTSPGWASSALTSPGWASSALTSPGWASSALTSPGWASSALTSPGWVSFQWRCTVRRCTSRLRANASIDDSSLCCKPTISNPAAVRFL